MAQAFFVQVAGERAMRWSGGSNPATHVNPAVVQAMAERELDISGEDPKPWTEGIIRASDIVITMGGRDTCPTLPGRHYEDWDIADPDGLDLPEVRPIRDDIEDRVRRLLEQLPSAAA